MRPFEDSALHRRLFRGRDDEKYELLNLVLAERIVLVFSRSGLGKSSLVNAGLLEPLRRKGHFPMSVRVGGPGSTPLDTIYDGIETAIGRAEDAGQIECEPPLAQTDRTSLWHFFKSLEIWQDDQLLSPVLIVDQFEELFTLRNAGEREQFKRELADLVRGIRPRRDDGVPERRFSDTPPDVKVVLVLREDFYANIQELRDRIPNIYKAPFRLTALGREQAREAIVEPAEIDDEEFSTRAFSWSPEALNLVLDFLSEQQLGEGRTGVGDEIEPFQLQLVCQHVEDLIRRVGLEQVTVDALGGPDALRSVLTDFYQRSLERICAAFPDQPDLRGKLELLCEEGLVTARGRRLLREESTIQEDDGVAPEVLAKMVELRLLRKEPRIGDNYYELTHDTLIEPIRQSRLARTQDDLNKTISRLGARQKKKDITLARVVTGSSMVSMALALGLLFYLWPGSPISIDAPSKLISEIKETHPTDPLTILSSFKETDGKGVSDPDRDPIALGFGQNPQLERLREALHAEIAEGVVEVKNLGANFILVRFPNRSLFLTASDAVTDEFRNGIARRLGEAFFIEAEVLREKGRRPGRVFVIGHTDTHPIPLVSRWNTNHELSEARARSVADAIFKFAPPELRFVVEGRGPDDPFCIPADDKACWPHNRRVELLIERAQ